MKKIVLIVFVLLAVVYAVFALDIGQYLSIESIKQQQSVLDEYVADQPVLAGVVYFLIYVAVAALSLPGAAVMTLAGGAIFGLGWGCCSFRLPQRLVPHWPC